MSAAKKSPPIEPAAHRTATPGTICISLSDIVNLLPAELLLRDIHPEETIDLPAGHVMAHIVPTLSLQLLGDLSPGLIAPASGMIRLPAHRIARAYRLEETTAPPSSHPDDFLFRDDIPSPAVNLGKIAAPEAQPEPVNSDNEREESNAETPPGRLAEIIGNLPVFQRVTETTFLTVKPLTMDSPSERQPATGEISDQHALQALLLTDENLDMQRVVELCGQLPGIHSCILTSEEEIVATSRSFPEGLDITSLTASASAMLRAMHDASAGTGIGHIPAVTLHTARGPLSIFQKDHLAMLVFHGDRGFVPGVHEKITSVIGELALVPLALPAPSQKF